MLVPREWSEEEELFELVAEALEESGQLQVIARPERSPYGEEGSIQFRTADGRLFHVSLQEVL